jgi:glycerol kinase
MEKESGVKLKSLRVDGGMVKNDLLMKFQSDVLGVPVIRPEITETTSLGAAYAAGLAVGYWQGTRELEKQWSEDQTWHPEMDQAQRARQIQGWKKAVTRSFNWVE